MIIRPEQYTLADIFKDAGYRTGAFGKWHLGLGDKGGGKALWKDENIADSITVHALNFIEENKDFPFFIYLATNDIHVPRFPHQRFRGRSGMGLRGDAITEFDWTVGSVMEKLEELGLADNTLLLVTSDNGPVLDDGYVDQARELLNGHDPSGALRGNKYTVYEAGARVPAIIRWPGQVPAGAVSEAIVSQIDLCGSLGSLLKAALPKDAAPDSCDGLDAWLGQDPVGRDYVIEQANDRTLSVRTAEWKYIEPSNGPSSYSWASGVELGYQKEPQLYHLTTDPAERHNLVAERPDILAQLQAILEKEHL